MSAEPNDPRRDCPWKCLPGTAECLCAMGVRTLDAILRDEIDSLRSINQAMGVELACHKAAADHWRGMCRWVHATSREALMADPMRPRAAREKRDQAIARINAHVGGAL